MAPVVPGESVPWGWSWTWLLCVKQASHAASSINQFDSPPPAKVVSELIDCWSCVWLSARRCHFAVAPGRTLEEALLFLFVCGCEVAQD
jgi:hypothetical protein